MIRNDFDTILNLIILETEYGSVGCDGDEEAYIVNYIFSVSILILW